MLFLRFLPVHAAERLGRTALETKAIALGYILGVFFVGLRLCRGMTAPR